MTNVKVVNVTEKDSMHFRNLPHWSFFEHDGRLLLKVGSSAYRVCGGGPTNVPELASVKKIRNVSVCIGGE